MKSPAGVAQIRGATDDLFVSLDTVLGGLTGELSKTAVNRDAADSADLVGALSRTARFAGVERVDLEEGELVARFDGRAVTYPFAELDALRPAYAVTIHKSQGSEYPAVVIPVMTQHYTMLQRNLLYTGVTRGRKLVVLVGQRKAIAIAVRNVAGRRRWTKLAEWLAAVQGQGAPEELPFLPHR